MVAALLTVTCWGIRRSGSSRRGALGCEMEIMTPHSAPGGKNAHRGRMAGAGTWHFLPPAQNAWPAAPSALREADQWSLCVKDTPPSWQVSELPAPEHLLGVSAPGQLLWPVSPTSTEQLAVRWARLSPLAAAVSLLHSLKNSPPIAQRGQADRETDGLHKWHHVYF